MSPACGCCTDTDPVPGGPPPRLALHRPACLASHPGSNGRESAAARAGAIAAGRRKPGVSDLKQPVSLTVTPQ